MNLLDSLLDAIVRLDGDALVMHVGEKPYVVTTSEATNQFRGPLAWGQVELSTRVLTTDAVSGMLGQILPIDQRAALDEFGATDYDVTAVNHPQERFTIVAARGGDDIWVEMRRHPKVVAQAVTAPAPEQTIAAAAPEPIAEAVAVAPAVVGASAESPVTVAEEPTADVVEAPTPVIQPQPAPEAVAVEVEAREEIPEPAQAEEVILEAEPEAEIEVPLLLEVSTGEPADSAFTEGFSVISLDDLDSGDAGQPVELHISPSEYAGLELDLDSPLEEQTLRLDADVEAGILAATEEWGDDVMTEGELGELLRATAAAVITGETLGIPPAHDTDESEAPFAAEPEPPVAEAPSTFADEEIRFAEPVAVVSEPVPVPEPEPELPTPIELVAETVAPEPVAVQARATVDETEPRMSRETRELPALVEYQIQRDLAVAAAPESPVAVEPVLPRAAEPERVHMQDHSEHSVPSTEGVWPVSDDVIPESSNATRDAAGESAQAPADVPVVRFASNETRDEDDAAPARPAAVVLPLTRQNKGEGGDARASVATNLQRLLRLAANRGAATVYVVANAAPVVRVDGEFSTLEGEPAMSTAIVDRLLAEVSPAKRESAPTSVEWLIDVPEIGRVRCLTFRDHRGPGIIFRMVPPRAIAADQLGLSSEVQALCSEADGLVLVTGGRDSGRSTLLTSFVDLINRTRADHIISVEPQIDFVHESKRSFISQREVRGEDAMVGAVRSACREEPDVLVLEEIRSHEVASLALEAAEAGRLVFASVPGVSTSSALERLIELFPADRREKAQASLAGSLRGVVAQVLLRKLRGGRVAAREVLLNTPPVAALIMEGKTFQLSAAIENGRRAGMSSFADSLASLVREGVVHPSHAQRKAPNREQLMAALNRDGVDMSMSERLG